MLLQLLCYKHPGRTLGGGYLTMQPSHPLIRDIGQHNTFQIFPKTAPWSHQSQFYISPVVSLFLVSYPLSTMLSKWSYFPSNPYSVAIFPAGPVNQWSPLWDFEPG